MLFPFALSHDSFSSVSCDLIPLSLLSALAVVVRVVRCYLKSEFFTSAWIIAQREHHTYHTYIHAHYLHTYISKYHVFPEAFFTDIS